jgi:hypothetical protein
LDGGIVDELLHAVAATAHRELPSGDDDRVHDAHHLVGVVHDEHTVRCADETPVVPAELQISVKRIAGIHLREVIP